MEWVPSLFSPLCPKMETCPVSGRPEHADGLECTSHVFCLQSAMGCREQNFQRLSQGLGPLRCRPVSDFGLWESLVVPLQFQK